MCGKDKTLIYFNIIEWIYLVVIVLDGVAVIGLAKLINCNHPDLSTAIGLSLLVALFAVGLFIYIMIVFLQITKSNYKQEKINAALQVEIVYLHEQLNLMRKFVYVTKKKVSKNG